MKCDRCVHRTEAGGRTWCDVQQTCAYSYAKGLDLGASLPGCAYEAKKKAKEEKADVQSQEPCSDG